MIFLQLFVTFLLIGAFTFGGGYSMIALIQNEVVDHHHWIGAAEFTDLLAVSQMTPGPIGINTATYAGYTAVLSAGYPQWAAVGGALLASLAVVAVPVVLVVSVGRWLAAHRTVAAVGSAMRTLRLAVVGLVAAAALSLFCTEFGLQRPADVATLFDADLRSTLLRLAIFAVVFALSLRRRSNPILLILLAAVAGVVFF